MSIGPAIPERFLKRKQAPISVAGPAAPPKRQKIGDLEGYKDLHERNIYNNNPPDFDELAELYEFFKEQCTQDPVTKKSKVDFTKSDAVYALTKALLKRDFGITWEMPRTHLCPPIPQRLNYVLWVQDLVDQFGGAPEKGPTIGFDVGTGASAIFPLLGNKQCGYHFVGTDIDPESIESSKTLAKVNGLEDALEFRLSKGTVFRDGMIEEGEYFAFTICNPPFFETMAETGLNTKRATEATKAELVTKGGEVGFIRRMAIESGSVRDQVGWFTTMLGKKASVKPLRKFILKRFKKAPPLVVETVFNQGNQGRWGLAWTFNKDLTKKWISTQRGKLEARVKNKKKVAWRIKDKSKETVFQSLERSCKTYGIKAKPDLSGSVLDADEEENGFAFKMTCYSYADGTMIEINFYKGDESLFYGFTHWLRGELGLGLN